MGFKTFLRQIQERKMSKVFKVIWLEDDGTHIIDGDTKTFISEKAALEYGTKIIREKLSNVKVAQVEQYLKELEKGKVKIKKKTFGFKLYIC